jgi:hypothetical protein
VIAAVRQAHWDSPVPAISSALLTRDNVVPDPAVRHRTIVTRLGISIVGSEAEGGEQDPCGAMIGVSVPCTEMPVQILPSVTVQRLEFWGG